MNTQLDTFMSCGRKLLRVDSKNIFALVIVRIAAIHDLYYCFSSLKFCSFSTDT